jgi:3-isopropylmalate dehydrogenase
MMLRFSLGQAESALRIENAVKAVLTKGLRTTDIYGKGGAGISKVSTLEMGDAVVAALR